MVCAFLGTVISLERAVGLPWRWPIAAPLLSAAAGASLITGGGMGAAAILFCLASAAFLAVTLGILTLRSELFTRLLALGAACWLGGNLTWLAGGTFPQVVPWWVGFLTLTITGERVDLGRFQKVRRGSRGCLAGALIVFTLGIPLASWNFSFGQRVLGAGLFLIATWLVVFDLAWKTVRVPGMPRFMALSLLSGFVWLGLAGVLWMDKAPVTSGFPYDAALHAFFLGFVFSMIFGHAPVIFPGILGLPMEYSPVFHLHLALLHGSLLLRVGSDLLEWLPGRRWGGILNAAALALFLVNTIAAILRSRRRRGPGTRTEAARA